MPHSALIAMLLSFLHLPPGAVPEAYVVRPDASLTCAVQPDPLRHAAFACCVRRLEGGEARWCGWVR